MSSFEGKVGLVTGAGDGIGRASARLFAKRGAAVGVLDINGEHASDTAAVIQQAGGRALALTVDVGDEDAVRSAIDLVVAEFGGLDFAHNNAGITAPAAPLHEVDAETWRRVVRVDLDGVFFCMKYEIPHLLAAGGGAICNTASTAGLSGYPGMPAYCASKHGVVGLTKSASVDYAPLGIRVTALCPGATSTTLARWFQDSVAGFSEQRMADGIPLGRVASPEEQARMAVWLCSDEASYVTGVAFAVDGGVQA